jgi:two-component system LytT family response regulator
MRSLIIDKDPASRESLSSLLSRQTQGNRIDSCEDCLSAAQILGRGAVDVAFLSIGVEELNGVEQLLRLPMSRLPRFAFLSDRLSDNRSEFQTPAGLEVLVFSKSAASEQIKSMLKDVDGRTTDLVGSEVHEQLRFIIEHCGNPGGTFDHESQAILPYLQRILVKNGSDSRLIHAGDIDWVESADHYVYLHSGGKSHLLYATMNDLQERLHPHLFIRAHRNAIINVNSVKKITNGKYGTLILTLADESEIRVSRSRREDVRRSLT